MSGKGVGSLRSGFNLTVVATLFLPLTFTTGLLGMNVAVIPTNTIRMVSGW